MYRVYFGLTSTADFDGAEMEKMGRTIVEWLAKYPRAEVRVVKVKQD